MNPYQPGKRSSLFSSIQIWFNSYTDRQDIVSKQSVLLRSRTGLSLIEIMIALVMTLIVLGAMMTAFQSVSGHMQKGRAMIDLATRVRTIETTLRSDLGNLTVEPRPYTTTNPPGFFQLVEGPRNDSTMAATISNVIGDLDDAISMTVQSKGVMFKGRYQPNPADPDTVVTIESPIAEVVWFTTWNELNDDGIPEYLDSFQLRRRAMLVLPTGVQLVPPHITGPGPYDGYWTWPEVVLFFRNNDISARIEPIPGTGNQFLIVPNQLADLAIRKNRFGHLPAALYGTQGAFLTWAPASPNPVLPFTTANADTSNLGFPNPLHYQMLKKLTCPDRRWFNPADPTENEEAHRRYTGNDLMLSNVVSFDVRVYSPNASLNRDSAGTFIMEPGEPGFDTINAGSTYNPSVATEHFGVGSFVDLHFMKSIGGLPVSWPAAATPAQRLGDYWNKVWFSGPSSTMSYLTNSISTWPGAIVGENTFDTWTPIYESDGINQNGNASIDEGTDGLDNDNQNGVDDIGERETQPPYNTALRGIEIRVRVVEKVTQQVHQVRIVHSFVPE